MALATTISDCRSTAQTGQGVGTELTGWNGDFSLHHSTLFGVSNQGTYYLLKKNFFLIKGRKRRGKNISKIQYIQAASHSDYIPFSRF